MRINPLRASSQFARGTCDSGRRLRHNHSSNRSTLNKGQIPGSTALHYNTRPLQNQSRLSSFTTDAASKLNVLRHDRHTLGVNRAQVGILKQSHKVSLSGLLQSQDGSRLKAKIRLEVLGYLTDKALERCLADEEVGRLLVLSDFTESDGSGSITMGLLDTTSRGGRLASSLNCNKTRIVYVSHCVQE